VTLPEGATFLILLSRHFGAREQRQHTGLVESTFGKQGGRIHIVTFTGIYRADAAFFEHDVIPVWLTAAHSAFAHVPTEGWWLGTDPSHGFFTTQQHRFRRRSLFIRNRYYDNATIVALTRLN